MYRFRGQLPRMLATRRSKRLRKSGVVLTVLYRRIYDLVCQFKRAMLTIVGLPRNVWPIPITMETESSNRKECRSFNECQFPRSTSHHGSVPTLRFRRLATKAYAGGSVQGACGFARKRKCDAEGPEHAGGIRPSIRRVRLPGGGPHGGSQAILPRVGGFSLFARDRQRNRAPQHRRLGPIRGRGQSRLALAFVPRPADALSHAIAPLRPNAVVCIRILIEICHLRVYAR
jgi:hypothetical protein